MSDGPTQSALSRSCWVVALAALLPYLLLPANPLVYDAYPTILANQAVQSGPLIELPALDFWGMSPDGVSLRSYRPLVSLTYAVQARIFGNAASLYHLTDMGLHATASVLLLLLMVTLGLPVRWGVPAAVLFAVHPVQTDAVCSAVGRADIMAACGLFAAMILHRTAPTRPRPGAWNTAAVVAIGASLLCKEYAVAFPFVLVVTDLALGRAEPSAAARRPAWNWTWAGSFALLGVYLWIRHSLFGALGGVPMLPEDHPLAGRPALVRWLTVPVLFALSARLIALPYGLNHHYRFGTLSIPESLLDARVLAGLVILVVLVAFAAWALVRKREAVPVVALALVVLPLAPSLNTLGVTGVLFAERFLYIPVAGAALFLAWALHRGLGHDRSGRVVTVILLLIAVIFAALTFRRVEAWGSMERLARTSIAAYPDGSEAWKQLGATLAEQARHEEAVEALERSVELNPADPAAWKVLADSRAALGRYEESADAWQRLVALSPPRAAVVVREAGAAELRANDPAAAIELLARAHATLPGDARSLALLAQAYMEQGDPDSAVRVVEAGVPALEGDASAIQPLLAQAWLRVASRRLREGRHEASIDAVRRALALPALAADAFFAGGVIAVRAGDPQLAGRAFDEAARRDPNLLRRKHDQAVLLIEQGRHEPAIAALREILVAEPDHAPTLFNLARALILAGRPSEAIEPLERGLTIQDDPRARSLLADLRSGT